MPLSDEADRHAHRKYSQPNLVTPLRVLQLCSVTMHVHKYEYTTLGPFGTPIPPTLQLCLKEEICTQSGSVTDKNLQVTTSYCHRSPLQHEAHHCSGSYAHHNTSHNTPLPHNAPVYNCKIANCNRICISDPLYTWCTLLLVTNLTG